MQSVKNIYTVSALRIVVLYMVQVQATGSLIIRTMVQRKSAVSTLRNDELRLASVIFKTLGVTF